MPSELDKEEVRQEDITGMCLPDDTKDQDVNMLN